ESAWPIYRLDARVSAEPPFYREVYGLDLSRPQLWPWSGASADSDDEDAFQPADALSRPGWIAVSKRLAARMGWQKGSTFPVSYGTRQAELEVGAVVDFERFSPQSSSKLAVMDIAQAQGLLGVRGQVHQVDVRVFRQRRRDAEEGEEGEEIRKEVARRLEEALGPWVEVLSGKEREDQARDLLGAFRFNLTALSLISLFVGLFLIYSSTQASLLRRREEFGLLRSLGATRAQVLAVILAEAAWLGALGVALGLPLGYWVASSNLEVVSSTVTNIYLLSEIESLQFPPWLLALAASVGLGGAVLGAWLPALDLSRQNPKDLLAAYTLRERIAHSALGMAALAVLILAATGAWYLWLGQGWKPSGFALGVALLVALPLFSPLLVRLSCGHLPVRGFGWGYSLRALGLDLQKTATAVAALSVAVSMLVGITLMIGSFRKTVEVWMEATLQADIYITTPSWRGRRSGATISPDLVESLSGHPAVEALDRLRSRQVVSGSNRILIAGVDLHLSGKDERFKLLAGDLEEALQAARQGAALISEPLARRSGLGVGDRLPVTVPSREVELPIAGIYYDYGSERGAAVVDWSTYAELFGLGPPSNLALYLHQGLDAEQVVEQLQEEFAGTPLFFRSNRSLRQAALRIFDQTFAVVRLLQGMSLLIAACAITLTLLILARERISELALYRALGAGRGQILRIYLGKGLGMAVLGLGLGWLGGLALAALLIFVINRAYFGWTVQVYWPWSTLAQETAGILLAAILAAFYPALRASRTPATELNRDEM
ncbi:MAG: FtsX-like permease family protein, partial [Acidobacteriota bacterium]